VVFHEHSTRLSRPELTTATLVPKVERQASFRRASDSSVEVRVSAALRGVSQSNDAAEVVSISMALVLQYEFERLEDISDADLELFASINGVYNAWPFVREGFHAGCSRVGLKPFVLPLLKIGRESREVDPK
jgi:hypothetical protein